MIELERVTTREEFLQILRELNSDLDLLEEPAGAVAIGNVRRLIAGAHLSIADSLT